jgi:hypothetical protein
MRVEVERPLIRTQNHGASHPPALDWPTVLGRLSGIMRSIVVETSIALEHPLNEDRVGALYSKALLRIEQEARRGEDLYSRWVNGELPEHKDL